MKRTSSISTLSCCLVCERERENRGGLGFGQQGYLPSVVFFLQVLESSLQGHLVTDVKCREVATDAVGRQLADAALACKKHGW